MILYMRWVTSQKWVGMMDIKYSRNSPRQIGRDPQEPDQLLAKNFVLAEVMRHLEITLQTLWQWLGQYGAMRAEDVA